MREKFNISTVQKDAHHSFIYKDGKKHLSPKAKLYSFIWTAMA